jgi:hypothetical protein
VSHWLHFEGTASRADTISVLDWRSAHIKQKLSAEDEVMNYRFYSYFDFYCLMHRDKSVCVSTRMPLQPFCWTLAALSVS